MKPIFFVTFLQKLSTKSFDAFSFDFGISSEGKTPIKCFFVTRLERRKCSISKLFIVF